MEAVADFLAKARSGAVEEAFHGLRALGPGAVRALQSAYLDEDDPIVRSLIVKAIWQQRQPSVIGFLAEVLQDRSPLVWKEALDGLVTLASPEAMTVLQLAANRASDLGQRDWIEEAIEQSVVALSA